VKICPDNYRDGNQKTSAVEFYGMKIEKYKIPKCGIINLKPGMEI
jgi:hypothetical protein